MHQPSKYGGESPDSEENGQKETVTFQKLQ